MINYDEQEYLNLLEDIINNGEARKDRTGVGTKALFGKQLKFSLRENKLPLLTTKKMFTRGVIEELLFFLRGETNTKLLEEKGVNIWRGNTSREFLDKRGLNYLPEGDMGKGYGAQWRNFGSVNDPYYSGVDQITKVFKSLKNEPHGRRHLVTAWNPADEEKMALTPCHYSFQFYVSNNKELSLLWNQRSVDSFLGLPFNITSYSILTHIFAKALGYTAKEIIFNGGDTHIYNNHTDQVKKQLLRVPNDFPTLEITKDLSSVKNMENLQCSDFKIHNYIHHSTIKAPMAV